MRRFLFPALLIASFSVHALQSVRVDNQVLVVGDSAARVKALLGEPSAHAKGSASDKSKAHKGTGKGAGKIKNKKATSQDKGEKWQYWRDGHTTTFTIVNGKIAHIEDVAR